MSVPSAEDIQTLASEARQRYLEWRTQRDLVNETKALLELQEHELRTRASNLGVARQDLLDAVQSPNGAPA